MRAGRLRTHQRRKLGELAVHELQPRLVRKARAPGRDGRRVAVDGDELARRGPSASRMRAVCPPRPNVAST